MLLSTTVEDARPAEVEAPLTLAEPSAVTMERQADLGISVTNGLSAPLLSLTVATVLTALVTVPAAARPGP